MFLLNSRSPLVTATSLLSPEAGTPYSEGTGLICRIPSPGLCRYALGYSPRGTCVGSWYDHPFGSAPLFTGTRNQRDSHRCFFLPVTSLLAMTAFHKTSGLERGVSPPRLSECVRMQTKHGWRRNINRLPIRQSRLRTALGSANPRLMNHVEETLPMRRTGFITRLCYYSFQDPYMNAVHTTSPPCFDPRTSPLYRITFRCPEVSVADFSPVHFLRPRS